MNTAISHRSPCLMGADITNALPAVLTRPGVHAATPRKPAPSVAYHRAAAMTLRLRAHGASPTVDAVLAAANAAWDAAMATAPVTISLRQAGLDDYEDCEVDGIGQHIAMTPEAHDGLRITRSSCERWLRAFEGLREPLTDDQWFSLACAIDIEIDQMVKREAREAEETNTEEREMPVVVLGLFAGDSAVAAE